MATVCGSAVWSGEAIEEVGRSLDTAIAAFDYRAAGASAPITRRRPSDRPTTVAAARGSPVRAD